jgi:uncharacterized protein YneF (UPF0154 family)
MPRVEGYRQNKRRVQIIAVVLCICLVVVGAYLGSEWLWRQLSNYVVPETPTERKDLVNIFVLIAAGVVGSLTALAAVGNLYISRKNLRQQRELDERRAQDDALQSYYEQMGDLLTVHRLRDKKNSDDPVRLLAQAQTETALRRVDATRKGGLVRFLRGAQLITGENPTIRLDRTDLSFVYLFGADLEVPNLAVPTLAVPTLEGQEMLLTNS